MPGLRILGAQNRNVRWAMVYVIYILVSIGLIVDTAVTLRYGNDFFTNPTGNPQAPPALGGTGANGTQADEKTTQFQIGRRNALITSGVVSSVGIAIGVISLVLSFASFGVQIYLDIRSKDRPIESEYTYKEIVAWVICGINSVLGLGNIALAVEFGFTAGIVQTYSNEEQADTPRFLIGAATMCALSSLMAFLTVFVDFSKCRAALRQVRAHTGVQPGNQNGREKAV